MKKKIKKNGEINFSDIYSTWSRDRTLVTVALESGDKEEEGGCFKAGDSSQSPESPWSAFTQGIL